MYDVDVVIMCVSALSIYDGIVDLESFGTRYGRYKLAHLIVKKEWINVAIKLNMDYI